MKKQETLATVHQLHPKKPPATSDLPFGPTHTFQLPEDILLQVVEAVIGRMRYHETIAADPYGYRRANDQHDKQFLPHAKLRYFLQEIIDHFRGSSINLEKAEMAVYKLNPEMFELYIANGHPDAIDARRRIEEAERERKVKAATKVGSSQSVPKESAADRRRRLAIEQREARLAAAAERKQRKADKKAGQEKARRQNGPAQKTSPPSK